VLYYDTHHRPATEPDAIRPRELPRFDGVIAFGGSLRDIFIRNFDTDPARTFVLHEAADADEFAPFPGVEPVRDLVFVGNWSDDRAREMETYFFAPQVKAKTLWGVLYPNHVQARMKATGVNYRGYLPNTHVPRVFAESRLVAHIHRGPYRQFLPGIPTIRMFEALACGSCLVSTPWDDAEHLFRPDDYVHLPPGDPTTIYRALLNDADARAAFSARGRETILARHTCNHRADELLAILNICQ
jgi:spore maturation protein CgeB